MESELLGRSQMLHGSISIFLLTSVLLVRTVSCQAVTTGRISGTVKDVQDAVIVAAEVSVENPEPGEKLTAVTDSSGFYSILQLLPATYSLNIRAMGFSPAVFRDVAIGLSETRIVNATLQV